MFKSIGPGKVSGQAHPPERFSDNTYYTGPPAFLPRDIAGERKSKVDYPHFVCLCQRESGVEPTKQRGSPMGLVLALPVFYFFGFVGGERGPGLFN